VIKCTSCLPTKTGRHDIAEILLKVALNTINQIKSLNVVNKIFSKMSVKHNKSNQIVKCCKQNFFKNVCSKDLRMEMI
jgi:hypothetical protein